MASATPRLTIQTASLYASGDANWFSGTGGPFGFSPSTSQFGGIVSSAGLATEPFNDTVYDVATGDELTFVIGIQNLVAGAAAYNIRIGDVMPTGFVVPASGIGLTVTDGTGTDLAFSGDLFGASGLSISPALSGYDANSGLNVALVTFSLAAGTTLPAPYATVRSTASILGYAASNGGADLAAANPASASTTIVTAAPVPVVSPVTDPSAVARGQTIAFDVTVSIPAGTLQDFTLTPVPSAGASTLQVISTSIVSVGAGLTTGTPVVAADGSVRFGNVTYSGTSGSNAITARILVRADGVASGAATLHTIIGAADPSSPGGRWTADVASNVGVVVPPAPPSLTGIAAIQGATTSSAVSPYASLVIGAGNMNQVGTLAITLQDASLGRLGNAVIGSISAQGDTFVATGTLAALQDAARRLTFTASTPGTARFSITVVAAAGGIAQNTTQTVAAAAPPPFTPPPVDPLFDAAFYLAHNPDVRAAGVDPWLHYVTSGWREGRDPNALFSTSYYLNSNPDVARAGVNPLLHYEQSGWKEGRAPDPYFDSNYYLTQNPDVRAAGMNPLLHFETNGWREGRDPSLVFSVSKYNGTYRDVAGAGIDPLEHFIQFGRNEGRSSFLTGGTAPVDPMVNASFYDRQLGAILLPTGAAAAQQASFAYHNGGWQKGLNPNPWFDTNYYLSHNPDVAAAHVDPLLHYDQNGWREGRDPSASFSTSKYLAAYPDVRAAGMDPLLHYINNGQMEGRTAFAV